MDGKQSPTSQTLAHPAATLPLSRIQIRNQPHVIKPADNQPAVSLMLPGMQSPPLNASILPARRHPEPQPRETDRDRGGFGAFVHSKLIRRRLF